MLSCIPESQRLNPGLLVSVYLSTDMLMCVPPLHISLKPIATIVLPRIECMHTTLTLCVIPKLFNIVMPLNHVIRARTKKLPHFFRLARTLALIQKG